MSLRLGEFDALLLDESGSDEAEHHEAGVMLGDRLRRVLDILENEVRKTIAADDRS